MQRISDKAILLVDDEVDALDTMKMLLEDDYQVLTASGGEQALSLLEARRVEVIIADQRMPGMPGVELLARVREQYPEVIRLILTAYTDFDAMLQAINEGRVYRYIIKPWDPEDMQVTIRQAFEFKELVSTQGILSAEIAESNRILAEKNQQLQHAQETIVQQEKLAVVGRFASEMTHEINNHLQVIVGVNTEYVADPEERQEIIERQAKMLSCITSDIRDFALGARMPFNHELVNPEDVCEDVIRTCEYHPAFRPVSIAFASEGDLELFNLDARQIKHLLFNLLKNAANASPPGSKIEVHLSCSDELELDVVDSGSGIPEDVQAKVWEPFFTTNGKSGTGLGLSVCRRVVEAHGGTIEFETSSDGGTRFIVRIPRLTGS